MIWRTCFRYTQLLKKSFNCYRPRINQTLPRLQVEKLRVFIDSPFHRERELLDVIVLPPLIVDGEDLVGCAEWRSTSCQSSADTNGTCY